MLSKLFIKKEKSYNDICHEIKATRKLANKARDSHIEFVNIYLSKIALKFDQGRMFFHWEEIDPTDDKTTFKATVIYQGRCIFSLDFDPSSPEDFYSFRKKLEEVRELANKNSKK